MRRSKLRWALPVAAATLLVAGVGTMLTAAPRPFQATMTTPERVLDTRLGLGAPQGFVQPGSVIHVDIPKALAGGASSVVVNLTATDAQGAGWARAWPCDGDVPPTSNINFVPGMTVANAVIQKFSSAGLCLSADTRVHLLVDVSGWFSGTSDFVGEEPNRILDTRPSNQPLVAGIERRLTVAGTPGVPGDSAFAALNVTVDRPVATGWLVAYPCGATTDASTVNFSAGETVANLTLVALSGGDVCFRSSVGAHLIVDTFGWSSSDGDLAVQSPSRLLDTRQAAWPNGKLTSGGTIHLRVAGRSGVPNSAASAVLTVTVTNPEAQGYVTVWPCDAPFPTASTINTWRGAVRSNLVLVNLATTEGTACLRYVSQNGTPTDLVVDAVGWTDGTTSRSTPTGPGTFVPAPTTPATSSSETGSSGGIAPAGPIQWSEDFQTPQGLDRMVKQISVGDNIENHNPMQHFNGDHNGACEGPDTTRALTEDYQLSTHFWYCAPKGPESGHFMTGINTVGYVIMAFTPKADGANTARVFPATATQACWDQNLTDLGSRKWTQLVVVSASRYQANGGGINYVNPDFNTNGGAEAIHLAGDDFLFVNLRNSVEYFNGQTKTFADYASDDYKGSKDKATRYTICVKDNGNGTVTRTQTRPSGKVSTITGPGRFPAGPRVFILEDDSYNPMKAYTDDGQTQYVPDPFTWHWDNIRIS